MRYIILLSHGHLATGMKSTIEMIVGQHENLISYDVYVDEHNGVNAFFDDFIKMHPNEEIVAVTDVLGGSVNNDILSYNNLSNVYVITGMNVALVLNLVLKSELDIESMIKESINDSAEMVMFFKKEVKDENEDL